MVAFGFFVLSLFMFGVWYVVRTYVHYDKNSKPYKYLGLNGIGGASLFGAIATILAIIISYNPWFSLPQTPDTVGIFSWEDSRFYMCVALILGLNMMALPMGFLIWLGMANKVVYELNESENNRE